MKLGLLDSLSHRLGLRILLPGAIGGALILATACGGETIIKEVPGETVIQTVIVEKEVPGAKVVETVVVEREVTIPGDTIIQTVVVSVPVPSDAPKPSTWGGTLKLAAHGPPAHFDFYASNTIANVGSQASMYNKLVRHVGITTDLPITGDLAHSWDISSDSKTYTFHLRDGVKFHDGSDFGAEDVKASYDRLIFPEDGLVSIRKTNFGAVSSVNVIDPLTVEFKLSEPRGPGWMLSAMAHGWALVVKKETIEDNNGDLKTVDNHPGTGPFKYVSRNDEVWVQERFDDYFDPSKPNADRVEHIWLVAWTPELSAAVLSGVVDWGMWLEAKTGKDIRAGNRDGLTGVRWTLPNIGGMSMNTTRPPFDDKRVRKAFALVIDQVAILEATKDLRDGDLGEWFLIDTPYALTTDEVKQTPGLREPTAEDITLAKSLFAEAGYPNGDGFPKIELSTRETPEQKIMNAAIQAMLKQGLNIDVDIVLADISVHGEKLTTGDFDFSTNAGYTVGLTDPAAYIVAGLGTCGDRPCDQNTGRWQNAEFDKLIGDLTSETNVAARIAITDAMREILLDEWPVIPAGPAPQYWAWSNDLKGMPPGDFSAHYDLHTWDDVWLLKK
ncbi:MAG: ABC transporter substrate-binding protein [Chloroflexi bacterium]|nr:ABC transporter substrate-binding protein [Chloroflexota bacterium]